MRRTAGILLCTLLCSAALAAEALRPATSQPASPKLTLAAYLRAMLAADEQDVLSHLVFTDDQSRADAIVILREILATARLRRAIVHQFDARGQDSAVGKKEERTIEDQLSLLSAATVTYEPERAQVRFDTGLLFHLSLREGIWKIDFNRSQQGMGGMPRKEDVDAARQRTAQLDQLGVEVTIGKLTLPEIESRYNAIKAGTGK